MSLETVYCSQTLMCRAFTVAGLSASLIVACIVVVGSGYAFYFFKRA